MSDRLKSSRPPTSQDRDSGTSLPASAAGATRSDSPASQMTQTSGPDRVRVSRSPKRARGAGRATLDIFGQHGSHSSESVALQRSLESRLRVLTDSRGSTLFTLTWKDAVTPSGRRICALRASGRRTSDSVSTSWPTPVVNDAKGSDYAYSQGDCSWATPAAHEAGGTLEQFLARKRRAKANGSSIGESVTSLSMQAQMTSWPTPIASDGDGGLRMANGKRGAMLREVIKGWSGSNAPTASVGQLNPAFSLWLQGYPTAWARLAAAVTRLSRKSLRRSSAPRSKP